MNILIKGSKGKNVQLLQHLLNDGLPNERRLKTDGNFGQQTDALVRAFQSTHHLVPDGIVATKTWALLTGQKRPIQIGILTKNPQPAQQSATSTSPVPRPDITSNLPINNLPSWLAIAELEKGIREIPGVMHNKRILQYHATTTLKAQDDETPWCSSFVNWCIIQAGLRGTNDARAISWLKWGVELASPRIGSILVIRKRISGVDHSTGSSSGNHVAFYKRGDNKMVTLLGGNQSDQVKESNFSLKGYEIIGCRWPK